MATILLLLLAYPVGAQAAVDILYFRATGAQDHVFIEWETAQEIDNVGFNLYRAETPDLVQASKLNEYLIPSQCLGQPFCDAHYSYTDSDVVAGITYYYWLQSVDTNNIAEFYSYDPESATPGVSPTATPTSTPTRTPTSTPTSLPTATPTYTPTATPTATPEPPTIASFQASPPSVQLGECTRLSWAVEGFISAVWLEEEGVGDHDFRDKCPTGTTTYTLRAVGPGGETTATINVPVIAPSATPSVATGTPTSTPASLVGASPTPVLSVPPSPALTTVPTGEPLIPSTPETGEATATPTSGSLVSDSPTPSDETPAPVSQSGTGAGPWPGVAWPTPHITTILLFVSVTSLLGAFLLAVAFPVVRKFGL